MGATTPEPGGGITSDWARRVLTWPLCVVVIAVHLIWADEAYDVVARILAGVLACASLVAFTHNSRRAMPVLSIGLAHFYVAMGRPVFSAPRLVTLSGPTHLSMRSLTTALLACTVFALAVALAAKGARGFGARSAQRLAQYLPARPQDNAETFVARMAAAVSCALWAFISLRGDNLFGPLAYPMVLLAQPAVSVGLLFWDWHRNQGATARILLGIAVVFLSGFGLLTGMLANALLPGVTAAVLLWTARGRAPSLWIVGGILLLLVFNAAKMQYRMLTWRATESLTVLDRIDNWQTALDRTYGGSRDSIETSIETTSSRTAVLFFVTQIIDWVPSRVPFAGPERWLEAPLLFTPRLLWPDKPTITQIYNNEYSLTFELQTRRGTESTTFNLPSVGDGYWRLGWLGVILEGLMLGTLIGFFEGASQLGSREGILLSIAFVNTMHVDAQVVKCIVGLPQFVIIMLSVLWATRLASDFVRRQTAASPQLSTSNRATSQP